MILNFNVNQQTVVLMKTSSVPRIGSKEYLALQFSFSSDWENLEKLVYLQCGDVSQPISIVDNLVEVPEWFTEQDSFNVTLFGTDGTTEVPTNVVSVQLEKSNELWQKDAPEPQPSWLVEVLESVEKAKASEDAAKLSETNAASSASSAQESAESASTSALNASTSATAAAESKTSAIDAKTAAEAAKTEASKSASAAKESETASKASETAASESATVAQSAQSGAEAAKTAAEQYAQQAAESVAVYESIASDVTQLKQDVEHLAPTIVCDASGDVITLDDSCDRPFSGLNLYGKTTQDGTPSPDSPVPLVSVGDGGSVSVTVSDGTSEQTLTVSTPNGLPGIPVNSGGNYTDSTGQQWICDEVDFARGVYVQRVNKLRVTESSGVHSISETYVRCQANVPRANNAHSSKAMNTLFPYNSDYTGEFAHAYVWSNLIYWFLPKETVQNVVEANAWLSDNDFRFAYVLETPVETALSEEELATYSALRTYTPTTNITNDAGAWMEIGYQADTKLYIDKQFAEIRNAIISLGGNI